MTERITLTNDEHTLVERLAAGGFGQRAIAKRLGISDATFKKKLKNDEALLCAYQAGLAIDEQELVDSLKKRALDPKNGSGAAAAMFLLKTRHGYRENAEVDTGPRVGIVFQMPAALKPEEYHKLIQVHTSVLAEGNANGTD